MYKTDIAAGIVLFFAGIVTIAFVIPAQISGHSDYGLPPDFFPRLLTWLFIGLAALLVLHRIIVWRALDRDMREADEKEAPMRAADWGFIAATTVFLIVLYLTMTHLGFIAAGILTIATVAALMGGHRSSLIVLALLTIAAPFAIFYAFRYLFLVFLPF